MSKNWLPIWFPIESAPRDGSRILVVRNGAVSIARWETQRHHRKPVPYWASDFPGHTYSDRLNPPSAWMSIPPIP